MSNEFSKALDALGEKFGIVIDWTQQNVQPYVQDLIQRAVKYRMAVDIITLVTMIILLTFAIIILSKNVTKIEFYDDGTLCEGSELELILTVLSSIVAFVAIITIPIEIANICQCYYLPEISFIKELQNLLK